MHPATLITTEVIPGLVIRINLGYDVAVEGWQYKLLITKWVRNFQCRILKTKTVTIII